MLRKIVLGTLFAGLIGTLVAGGVIRTMNKTAQAAEARGNGRGNGEASAYAAGDLGQGVGAQAQLNGHGGYGQGSAQGGVAERQYPNYEAMPQEWLVYEGVVVQGPPEEGVDLVIETSEGEEIKVGTGPMYMASQGFTLQASEPVQVRGYWEDSELKAAQVTRLTDGQTITLRDESGRPAWAGAGRNAYGRNRDSDGNISPDGAQTMERGAGRGRRAVDP